MKHRVENRDFNIISCGKTSSEHFNNFPKLNKLGYTKDYPFPKNDRDTNTLIDYNRYPDKNEN